MAVPIFVATFECEDKWGDPSTFELEVTDYGQTILSAEDVAQHIAKKKPYGNKMPISIVEVPGRHMEHCLDMLRRAFHDACALIYPSPFQIVDNETLHVSWYEIDMDFHSYLEVIDFIHSFRKQNPTSQVALAMDYQGGVSD